MIKRIEEGWPVKATASAAGVSVRTVYKWLARYRNEGLSGLIDRSSQARGCPHGLPLAWISFAPCAKPARPFDRPAIASTTDQPTVCVR
ncbi:MAG: leucine zipper domain-containing protein [Pyrinomonadaceae bacterium]